MSFNIDQLRFPCPACGRRIGIAPHMAGRQVACPGCGKPVTVPNAAKLQTAAAPAEDSPGFTLRARRAEIEELDLTPMVDVTFLLLIFFMITASFNLQKTLEVPPPDPETQGASPVPLEQIEENSVVVRVEPGDIWFVDETPVNTLDDLPAAIARAMAEGGRTELVIEASDAARHEAVVNVYDAGNEVGMQRIRLASTAGS